MGGRRCEANAWPPSSPAVDRGSEGVRTAALLDAAWPEPDRPATARRSLANIIARLRAQVRAVVHRDDRFGLSPRVERGLRPGRILDAADSAENDQIGTIPTLVAQTKTPSGRWRGEPWVDVSIEEVEPDRARLHAARLSLLRVRARELPRQRRHAEAVEHSRAGRTHRRRHRARLVRARPIARSTRTAGGRDRATPRGATGPRAQGPRDRCNRSPRSNLSSSTEPGARRVRSGERTR